jgi:phosphoenolpyruvate carboxykinase (ATP)
MVHKPHLHAELLKAKVQEHKVSCWLVNTGWTGGPFGVGERFSIQPARRLLNGALDGSLHDVQFRADPVFGFQVPLECEGVPNEVLETSATWPSKAEYERKHDALAARFIKNFKLFAAERPAEVKAAGSRRRIRGN